MCVRSLPVFRGKGATSVAPQGQRRQEDVEVCRPLHTMLMLYRTSLKDGILSVADSVSVALMTRDGIRQIVSFDGDFEKIKQIQRIC